MLHCVRHDEGGRTCDFNSQVPTTSPCIWFYGFIILSFYTRDCSLQFHTCSYLCILNDAFISHSEFGTYFHTLDLKKKHTLLHTQHLQSYHMHCIQINYYTKGTLMQALIQFSRSIEVRLSFVNTLVISVYITLGFVIVT
jgi:hypothetical protein